MRLNFQVSSLENVSSKLTGSSQLGLPQLEGSTANTAINTIHRETRSVTGSDASSGEVISLPERLFDNAAELKIDMSVVAMHLSARWRDAIRSQIDRLLSCDDWDDDSAQIERASFKTFLRFLAFMAPKKIAGLGVSAKGTLLAAWHLDRKKVSIEFGVDDKANTFFSRPTDRGQEVVVWSGHIGELGDFIQRIGYMDCLR
ncbi:MAG: hypothetical protein JSR99_13715 [Proteobacteria bacterium]|nr:hypothetical protein [Pseudomonadota bacterium]